MVVLYSIVKLILPKTEIKRFIIYLHELVRERQKYEKENLMASVTFICSLSCTAFYYMLKITSTIAIHINSAKLSPQVIFPQKEYSVLDKTIIIYEIHSVFNCILQ